MPEAWTAPTPKTLADAHVVQAKGWERAGSSSYDTPKTGATSGRLYFGQRAQGSMDLLSLQVALSSISFLSGVNGKCPAMQATGVSALAATLHKGPVQSLTALHIHPWASCQHCAAQPQGRQHYTGSGRPHIQWAPYACPGGSMSVICRWATQVDNGGGV